MLAIFEHNHFEPQGGMLEHERIASRVTQNHSA
jgi:hypothetical protein